MNAAAILWPEFSRGRPHHKNPTIDPMKLTKITRTNDLVRYVHEVDLSGGSKEDRDVTAYDAPLKKFDTALQALGAVAVKVMELDDTYGKGITVTSLGVSYTKAGTRSATIYFKKQIDKLAILHPMVTPAFQIDDPGEGEDKSQKRQVLPKHAGLVEDMLDQAIKYANGDRQQMQLPLGGKKAIAKADDDSDSGNLKFPPGSPESGD